MLCCGGGKGCVLSNQGDHFTKLSRLLQTLLHGYMIFLTHTPMVFTASRKLPREQLAGFKAVPGLPPNYGPSAHDTRNGKNLPAKLKEAATRKIWWSKTHKIITLNNYHAVAAHDFSITPLEAE